MLAYVPEGSGNPPTVRMRFPGTITIPEATFEEILVSTGRGFRRHAFKDIVFIGDHGGYQKSMQKAADALNREWKATSVRAHALLDYYRAAEADYAKALTAKGLAGPRMGPGRRGRRRPQARQRRVGQAGRGPDRRTIHRRNKETDGAPVELSLRPSGAPPQ